MCDLNSAAVEEIAALPGMTMPQALGLLLWRPYRSWAELENSPGFDAADIATLKAAGAVLGPSPALPEWGPAFRP